MSRAAVFDVDGTLVDTNHLHVVAWWEAFRQAGHQVSMHDVHRAVGLPSGDLITHLLGEERDPQEKDTLSAAHKALYGTYFERLPALPDAGRLLRRLDGAGWSVVLATSAGGTELAALRRAIGADDAITATTSADDVAEGKPAPDPVEQALELAGARAERSVFVGDTVWDMRAGARAGVRCVAVLSGGIPRVELEAAGAEAVFRDPAHLLAALEESPLGREE
ncbi:MULTISPECIES: HAD family hydrolase [Streptomyces]|uniref:HAD family hydrolase n=1 Tax=Streptomyces TaxID=1883 RepID=UPI000BC8D088|nr:MULTISPECIES: HAD family hydrolase [Streptomyces]MDX2552454.1 HAD family hydrolase [Streptomyces stelliscabiei]MDX2611849.1 HAD family hydrolase [Streptomyces stelliscabiei]MDX2637196.1 HAD family hydrolase [Streptomyces stelliscabiei]MDX2660615.1 HAD family hydrolase [Streptomyces stelliscabiei]MDX2714929.1 HAD family hydrolase [Streptomyces stelliscabiei]